MRIIAKTRLFALADRYGDCTDQVRRWYQIARRAAWANLGEVRQTFAAADAVDDKTVFNIKGNDYRLIVGIDYAHRVIYIKGLLTHAEYDIGDWKNI